MRTKVDYIPESFFEIPSLLAPVNPPATQDELQHAQSVRSEFIFQNHGLPYVTDIVRAWRLVRGCNVYLEIGTFDRGNLAYTSTIADENALLIGLDIADNPARDQQLRQFLRPGQTYVPVVGDSSADETVEQVKQILGDRKCDAIFIDGNHVANYVMSDYARYAPLIQDSGFILFHDILWEGNAHEKGVSQALQCIDRLDPIFSVVMDHPVHRYMPLMIVEEQWGGVAIIPAGLRFATRRRHGYV